MSVSPSTTSERLIEKMELEKTSFGRDQLVIHLGNSTDSEHIEKLRAMPALLNDAGLAAYIDVKEGGETVLVTYGFHDVQRVKDVLQPQGYNIPEIADIRPTKSADSHHSITEAQDFIKDNSLRAAAAVGMLGHTLTGVIGVLLNDPARITNGVMYGLSTSLLLKYGNSKDEINFDPILQGTKEFLGDEGIMFDSHVNGADRKRNILQKGEQYLHDNAFVIANLFGGLGDAAQLASGLSDGSVGAGRIFQGGTSLLGCAAQIFANEKPVDPDEMKGKSFLERGIAELNAHPLAIAGNINLFQNFAGFYDAASIKQYYMEVRKHGAGDMLETYSRIAEHLSGSQKNEFRSALDSAHNEIAGFSDLNDKARAEKLTGLFNRLDENFQGSLADYMVDTGDSLTPPGMIERGVDGIKGLFDKDKTPKVEKTPLSKEIETLEKQRNDYNSANSKYVENNLVPALTVGVAVLYGLSSYLTSISTKSRDASFSNEDAYHELYGRVTAAIVALAPEKQEEALQKSAVFIASHPDVAITSDEIIKNVHDRLEAFSKSPLVDIESSQARTHRMALHHELQTGKAENNIVPYQRVNDVVSEGKTQDIKESVSLSV
jgi:hypothetical protein